MKVSDCPARFSNIWWRHCNHAVMQIDERSLPEVAELLHQNTRLASVKLTDNRISCTEFEHCGLELMRLLSSNNMITVGLMLSVSVVE